MPSVREDWVRAEMDSADSRLARAIGRAVELLPDARRAPFLEASEKWYDYWRRECQSASTVFEGGTIASPAYASCMIGLARDRARFLSAAYSFDLMDPDNHGGCLAYEPEVVSLTGKLQRRVYPGRPNYESVAKGDEAESGFYLVLAVPACVSRNLDEIDQPAAGVRSVQLVLDQHGYDRLRPSLGKTIDVRGTLVHSHTGHHHAALLLEVKL